MPLKRRSAASVSADGESSSRCSCVGTSEVKRILSVSSSAAAVKASGVKPPLMSMTQGRVPANSERTSTWTPATYCTGRASSHWPSPLSAKAVAMEDAASASTVSTVALGVPVEPEVRTTTAASSQPGVSGSPHGPVRAGGEFDGGTLAVEGGRQRLEGGLDVQGCRGHGLP